MLLNVMLLLMNQNDTRLYIFCCVHIWECVGDLHCRYLSLFSWSYIERSSLMCILCYYLISLLVLCIESIFSSHVVSTRNIVKMHESIDLISYSNTCTPCKCSQPRWLSSLRRSLDHSLMIARHCVMRNWIESRSVVSFLGLASQEPHSVLKINTKQPFQDPLEVGDNINIDNK